ncbi:14533_t:CDS:1 [Cetraspora pellucida]|uniref:14533_t:CDS:1 n=1 Tax=Cetraspora pellucida TaxID=1433469 RepID=A0ACA9LI70_9GLOM|nr:14533_t:CDS:1 [Cetraspora pellucida]
MDKSCNKCKKVFGATEGRYTGDIERKGKKVPLTLCKNCIVCDNCKNAQAIAEVEGKDFYFVCQKCKDDLNDSGKICTFCKKSITSGGYHSSPDKPGIIACDNCLSELAKPKNYDTNAKIY